MAFHQKLGEPEKNPLTYHCIKGIHCSRDVCKLASHCFEPNLIGEKQKNSGP